MGQRGRDAVVAKYTREVIAHRMEAVYRTTRKGRECARQAASSEAYE